MALRHNNSYLANIDYAERDSVFPKPKVCAKIS